MGNLSAGDSAVGRGGAAPLAFVEEGKHEHGLKLLQEPR